MSQRIVTDIEFELTTTERLEALGCRSGHPGRAG